MYSISLYIGYECNLFGTVMLYAVVMICVVQVFQYSSILVFWYSSISSIWQSGQSRCDDDANFKSRSMKIKYIAWGLNNNK